VAFIVLPAIDVAAGRLGLWSSSGPAGLDAYGGDPVAAARAFAEAGAAWLHVVDMDLARTGSPANLEVVAAIAEALPNVRIQTSGGIGTAEVARLYRHAGAERFVLASSALVDPDGTMELLAGSVGHVLVGVEVEDGRIRGRGRARVDLDLMHTLGWLASAGAPGFLVTAVARVGAGEGPDLALIRRVARVGLPVVAAGGIASLEDLRAVRDAGAGGAVVGRAALLGELDLPAAFSWAAA
jgi:phosphoribosylformimino-5-aminoimidazole carboxamide ribonucleotide (ProFAR) isomerase